MGHEPLQEQPPRHRVQPLRGARPRRGPGHRARSPRSTARPRATILAEVDRLAREDLAASFEDSDRNPPVFDPETHTAPLPGVVQEELPRLDGRRVLAAARPWPSSAAPPPPPRSTGRSARWCSAPTPPIWMYGAGPMFAGVIHRNGNERDQRIAQLIVEQRLGHHDGADRARRRLRRRRRPRQGHRRTTTAPGTSRASSASSPPARATSATTSSTWCWPARSASRASAARAPRA